MTRPPRSDPAGAGLTLVATIVLCTAIGLGIGALIDYAAPLALAGLFIGSLAGFALVYARFKDI